MGNDKYATNAAAEATAKEAERRVVESWGRVVETAARLMATAERVTLAARDLRALALEAFAVGGGLRVDFKRARQAERLSGGGNAPTLIGGELDNARRAVALECWPARTATIARLEQALAELEATASTVRGTIERAVCPEAVLTERGTAGDKGADA